MGKRIITRRKLSIIGQIIATIMILFGIFYPTPDKYISSSSLWGESYTEYVGGDAYNIQIEASLRAGYISGIIAMKTILISVGAFICLFSLYVLTQDNSVYNVVQCVPVNLSPNTQIPPSVNEQSQQHLQSQQQPVDKVESVIQNPTSQAEDITSNNLS